jgi:acetyl-CoA carboxylase biotin carboxyl carrier protein
MARSTVRTEITGKVWKITAEKGQRLAEDEPIVILESMKMEIPVAAPIACTVIDIVVVEGDSVTEGDIIAHVET